MSQTKAQLIGDLTQALEFITTASTPADGLYLKATNQIALATNSVDRITAGTSELVINESGASVDFRVEGDTNANLLFVDASTDRIGIGTSSPTQFLSISGSGATLSGTAAVSLFDSNSNGSRRWSISNGAGGNTVDLIGKLVFSCGNGSSTADPMEGIAAAVIDLSGRVGIGTTSPAALLHLADNNPHIRLEDENDNQDWEIVGSDLFRIRDITNSSADRFVINSSGRIGIGTTSPSELVHLVGVSSSGGMRFSDASTNRFSLRLDSSNNAKLETFQSADSIVFSTGGSGAERARIDNSGRLLVGTNTSLVSGSAIQAIGRHPLELLRYSAATGNAGAKLQITRSASDTVGTPAAVSATDDLGEINFVGATSSSTFNQGAKIAATVESGTISSTSLPTKLTFHTTANGAASAQERMKIDSNGFFTYGGTGSSTVVIFPDNSAGAPTQDFNRANTSSTSTCMRFRNFGTIIGTITYNNSTAAFNTGSDYRLKENVVPVSDGIDRLKQLKPSRFNFIVNPDKTVDGFIAHEAQAVVPEAVTGTKDEVDENGDPVMQGIDQSKLVPLLTAALQEAIVKIETLESEVAALKGA